MSESQVTKCNSFTVAMCLYKNDNPVFFREALKSILTQTSRPSEIVIVIDGPIPVSIEVVLAEFVAAYPDIIKLVRFEINQGHAAARAAGLLHASNEIVAIMDSDDIAVETRFEVELKYLNSNPDVSIVGGNIAEFIDSINNVVAYRNVPELDADIKKYMKSRCPFNQMTVMFRKSDVIGVGGYMDWFCNEDYYLWIRMAEAKLTFHNLQDVLVYMRVGRDMYARRGGWKYFKSEAKLQQYMYNHSIISMPRYIYNVLVRLAVQVLMPNSIRALVFQKLLRK